MPGNDTLCQKVTPAFEKAGQNFWFALVGRSFVCGLCRERRPLRCPVTTRCVRKLRQLLKKLGKTFGSLWSAVPSSAASVVKDVHWDAR
jgi:hypothetical protein